MTAHLNVHDISSNNPGGGGLHVWLTGGYVTGSAWVHKRRTPVVLDRVRTVTGLGARATRAVWDVGLLHPVRPDRAARLPLPYLRFGPTPATAGAMAALRFPGRTALHDEGGSLTYAELN